jgi:DNA-binding IclR family transcriptional regulator
VLLKAHRSLGITQLAKELQLSKSTTHDLVAALCALGFVDQNPTTRRYSVSPEIFRFLHLVSTEFGPNSAVKPLLRAQARKLKASIVITALCRRSTYALCASGANAGTFLLGDNGPAFNSACGKILVAQLEETVWPEYAPKPGDKTRFAVLQSRSETLPAEVPRGAGEWGRLESSRA